ncbi:hypothetical protein ACQCVP_09330 [Rossellomorea vietnamensis]|uniref:hypothetical protein n=1 Tax=Rossellomorea vietnamensis TaxID=218284 RepID=UPI003CEFCF6D
MKFIGITVLTLLLLIITTNVLAEDRAVLVEEKPLFLNDESLKHQESGNKLRKENLNTTNASNDAYAELHDPLNAMQEGYIPFEDPNGRLNISDVDEYYINPIYLTDEEINTEKPEALLYILDSEGVIRLAGVEYISLDERAEVNGESFMPIEGTPIYTLRDWFDDNSSEKQQAKMPLISK